MNKSDIYFLLERRQICIFSASAIMRAVGDSKRPLYFLILTSVLNIILDLLFVLGLHTGIAGVAWATIISQFVSAIAIMALLYPKQSVELTMSFKNIMSVNVPVYDFQTKTKSDSDIYPYGFAATSGELDTAVDALGKVFQKMLKLAEIEKSAQLMAEEIEKTRRRVNALEYVMIPNTQDAIRYITMKLVVQLENRCLTKMTVRLETHR